MTKGDEPKFTVTSWDYSGTGTVFTKENAHPEETIKALDYLFSEEGSMLKNFGIEGQTYTLVDGQPKFTDLIMNNPDKLPIGQAMAKSFIANYPFVGPDDDCYNEQYYALQPQKDAVKTYAKFAANSYTVMVPPIALTPEESSEYAKIMTDINLLTSNTICYII